MKRSLLLIITVLVISGLSAVSRDDFIIGAYSQYQLHHAHQTDQVFADLGNLLHQGGFNTMLYSTRYEEVVNGRLKLAL